MTWDLIADQVSHLSPDDALPAHQSIVARRVRGPLALVSALPLGEGATVIVVRDADGTWYPIPAVHVDGRLRRALPGDGVSARLIAQLGGMAASQGEGKDRAGGWLARSWVKEAPTGERTIEVDQTNESIVVGERAVVKWPLHLDPGPHPATTKLAGLTEAGFPHMPRLWGMLHWRTSGEPLRLAATVTQFVPGATDGWTWALEDVRTFAKRQRSLLDSTQAAEATGTVTGRMHAAMARRREKVVSPAVASDGATPTWSDLDDALAVTQGPEGRYLKHRGDEVRAGLALLAALDGSVLTQIHGDLHVGQFLAVGGPTGRSYLVTDFDGSPISAPQERLCPQPAAVDVAGMLQSWDHVGYVALRHTEGIDPRAVEAWRRTAGKRFLIAYRASLRAQGATDLLDDRLIAPLRLRQICREYVYAGRHLPRWAYVPDAALRNWFGDPPPASRALTLPTEAR